MSEPKVVVLEERPVDLFGWEHRTTATFHEGAEVVIANEYRGRSLKEWCVITAAALSPTALSALVRACQETGK